MTWSRCEFWIVWINYAVPLPMFQKRISFKCVVTMIVSDHDKSMLLILVGHCADVCCPVDMFHDRIVLSLLAEIKLFRL